MTTALLERPELRNNSKDGWPVAVDMKLICPGVVHYEDLRDAKGNVFAGEILADKEFLDSIAASIDGRPIVNWDHRQVDPKEFSKGSFQGIITGPAVFNALDGYYHAKGYIWDEATRRNIERGFSVSCAYKISGWDNKPGTHAAVPYHDAARKGFYTHVAVVEDPRYERAEIEVLNSNGGKPMGIMSLFRKDKAEEKIEIDIETAAIKVGDSEVKLTELINSFKKSQAAAPKPGSVGLDDLIEVDGKKVLVREMLNAHVQELKNAEASKMKEEHEAGDHKENMRKNCSYCNSADEAERKRKEDEDRKNAADKADKDKKDAEERQNSAAKAAKEQADKEAAEAIKNAAVLEEARNKAQKIELPKIVTLSEQVAEGKNRYGIKTPLAVK